MYKNGKKVEKLNELIQVCKDGRRGFWQAASEVDNKSSVELLKKEALQRNAFAYDLQDAALKLGLRPAADGSMMGKLHRAWMSLRHQVNPHHDAVVLLECKRGEEHALTVYQDVFENHLLPEMEPILEQQFVTMIEMRDELGAMTEKKKSESTDSVLRLL